MELNVVKLTQDLVAANSESQRSNVEVAAVLQEALQCGGFEVERLEYSDENGECKVSLVGRKGTGTGGLALFSHSDTVPGNEWDRNPLEPIVEGGRLIGLGSCDMKGPSAATIVAGARFKPDRLKKPLLIVITSDEEITYAGAFQVVKESVLFKESRCRFGVVAEPSQLMPVYAHKGGCRIFVTAHGKAAHTSTDNGISANFIIAPFLAEMAELAKLYKTDESFQNREFTPPTNGFNMVLNDGGCRANISAPKTVCTIGYRSMPDARSPEVLAMVKARAEKYGLEFDSFEFPPFYISPQAEIIRMAVEASEAKQAITVPFGTEATVYLDYLEPVVLGPGNIAQAHTNGEWIEVAQLERAVSVYERMIERVCS